MLNMIHYQDFTRKKDMIFCGVFDGHDPLGHRLSQCIRDNLPSKLSAPIKLSQEKAMKHCHANATNGGSHSDVHVEDNQNMSFPSWEGTFMRCYSESMKSLLRTLTLMNFVAVALLYL